MSVVLWAITILLLVFGSAMLGAFAMADEKQIDNSRPHPLLGDPRFWALCLLVGGGLNAVMLVALAT